LLTAKIHNCILLDNFADIKLVRNPIEPIIPPVPKHLLEEELNKERFVRYSSRGENTLYDINAHEAPNTMREIGRLREIAFRVAGGGTGIASDIDHYDTHP